MSNASLFVKTPTGILYGQYHGTSDVAHYALFGSPDEAWSHDRHVPEGYRALERRCDCRDGIMCPAFSSYGSGACWDTKVCITHQCLIGHTSPYDDDGSVFGKPDWVRKLEKDE